MINSFCLESGNKNVMGYDLSLTITDQRRGREGMARMDIRFALKQVIKQGVQNVVLPACYQVNRGRAVDRKLVVFADAHHNSRPAAMELLYRRLKKSGRYRIIEHYLDYGTAGAGQVARHSIRFMKLYASAGFVVICDNFLPAASCRKRGETKVIQLWHACGCYKKFGYDARDDIPAHYHGANVYRNADLVTVSGKAAVKPFASAMRLREDIVQPIGVSRTDLYFSKAWRERCVSQFYGRYPQAKGKKVVLWAPTFRGNAGVPENVSLDLSRLQEELGDGYLVLARLHPHMRPLPGREKTNGNGAWEKYLCDLPTEELYPVTDVLIADYSSLVYEYLLFRKPLILYVPDLETYRKRRGFYMQIEQLPGRIVTHRPELAAAVQNIAHAAENSTDPGAFRQDINVGSARIETFLEAYMGACDGKATTRIVKWIEDQG
jgi:CDP-ribitol ribitolphosphotransferase